MADQSGEENKQTQINTMTIHPDKRNDESNTDNKLKRARSNENLSETEQETNKRLKKDDIGNELDELKTLMYDLAVEMKDMNDKVFERIDNLENTFAKNIVENISKMIDNKINKEVNKVKDDFKAQMTTVNKRIDGIVNKLKSDIKNIHTEVADKVRTDLISSQADAKSDKIHVEGYTCFQRNRDKVHVNSKRGSGGVAALVKNDLLKYYNVEILNSEVQDILWIKLSNENDIICLCVCYLPPEHSVYNDSLVIYTKLLEQVYMYQNIGTGKSVVDYVLTPYEQLNEVINFKVNTMSDLVTELSLVGYESIPDHSLLEWGIRVRTDMSEVEQNENGKGANRVIGPRKLDGLNNEPFSSENMQNVLRDTICRIEVALNRSKDVNKAFIELKHLLIKELELTCKELKPPVSNKRTNKCKRKPYWSEELQDSWNKTCDAERQWKRCKSIGKSKLRTRFIQSRKDFDKLNRKAKRNYQLEQQNKLQKLGEKNSSEFWKSIGKLGLANDRKSRQTFQIRSETGEIISDIDSVLEKWKIDYEKLYNSADMNGSYDDEFLKDIKNKLQNRNNLVNDNNIDTTELNRAIERD
ncbi:unnamed protein product [Mytilus edulis]|uniref:Uncharacterized protein n=1 Tax=Mytilus edulis TaxID=6550 RepID=A0A8S3V8H8_MYTED|nr:unnamed protein product [Mytilus edulis]